MRASKTCMIGIDVSKTQLDVAVSPSGETTGFANTDMGIEELVAWATRLPAAPHCLRSHWGARNPGDQSAHGSQLPGGGGQPAPGA